MVARLDLGHYPDLVAERRARAVKLTRWGRPAWQVARDLDVAERTVQRYLADERAGRPVGKQPGEAARRRAAELIPMLERGMSERAIARECGVNKSTVFRWKKILAVA
jgi:hypothetical protein